MFMLAELTREWQCPSGGQLGVGACEVRGVPFLGYAQPEKDRTLYGVGLGAMAYS